MTRGKGHMQSARGSGGGVDCNVGNVYYCILYMLNARPDDGGGGGGSEVVGVGGWAYACGCGGSECGQAVVWGVGESSRACGLPDRKLDKLAAQRKCMKCAT